MSCGGRARCAHRSRRFASDGTPTATNLDEADIRNLFQIGLDDDETAHQTGYCLFATSDVRAGTITGRSQTAGPWQTGGGQVIELPARVGQLSRSSSGEGFTRRGPDHGN